MRRDAAPTILSRDSEALSREGEGLSPEGEATERFALAGVFFDMGESYCRLDEVQSGG